MRFVKRVPPVGKLKAVFVQSRDSPLLAPGMGSGQLFVLDVDGDDGMTFNFLVEL